MSSDFKGNISFSIFGESHGAAIGVVIDNLPAGEPIDSDKILSFMARRAPRKDGTSTFRAEKDFPEILSGITDGKTNGAPLAAIIRNTDQHSADYGSVSHLARPGHADYTGYLRYHGANDLRGGGHFSGRLTAPLVFAGAVASQILERRGITVGAHIYSIKDINDIPFDPVSINEETLNETKTRYLPVVDKSTGEKMFQLINSARENQDSVGGIVECAAIGVPAGIGSPIFDGIENRISQLVFGIPAVKGVEFGAGFSASQLFGSENNDEFVTDSKTIVTKTNNHGGILGGISSGMPIIVRAAFKPTPSIARRQNTVDYTTMTNEVLEIKGRHDPCVVPRAVPCVEAAVCLAILSLI